MIDKKEIDQARLREAFYTTFDRSRMTYALTRLAEGRTVSGFELIGEGMHFRCWRTTSGPAMDLVVKLGTPLLLKELGNPWTWADGLSHLQAQRVPGLQLLPPFQFVKVGAGDNIGMIMPYGPNPSSECSAHWQPLANKLQEFYAAIQVHEFQLGDIPQMRCWDGIPFFIDLSDLRSIPGATHLEFNESSMRR